MSTEIVDYEKVLADMAKVATEIERPMGSSIGTKAGVLTHNGTPCLGNKLDVIALASVHSNLYYDVKYDSDNPSSPVCFAYSETGEGMAPHPASSKPQSESCDTCWANKWKSDPDGGKGKACKNGRAIACIPADVKAADVPTAEIAILKPPVTSVKGWQMYVQKCAALYQKPPMAIITQIGSVPDQKTQYKITFTDTGVVDKSLLGPLIARIPAALELCQKAYDPPEERAPEPEGKAKKFAV